LTAVSRLWDISITGIPIIAPYTAHPDGRRSDARGYKRMTADPFLVFSVP